MPYLSLVKKSILSVVAKTKKQKYKILKLSLHFYNINKQNHLLYLTNATCSVLNIFLKYAFRKNCE